jgi:glycosyltransferase involved in cell wall biosynthesis
MSRIERPLISIVAPVYNERDNVTELVHRLAAVCGPLESRYRFEFLLVDDGSTDDTLDVARRLAAMEPRLRIIELRRNFGQSAALQAGLARAAGAYVISMDADLQHFPEDIPLFVEQAEQGFDLVCGWRHERKENILRRWPSRVANWLIRKVSGLPIHDFGTTFRLYRADLVRHIKLIGEEHRFVPALAQIVGARVTEVRIQNADRMRGKSNYGLGRTFGVALDILYLYFARYYFTRPLRVFGKIAALLFSTGFVIAAWLLILALVTGEPTVRVRSGWFILSALLVLASVQVMLAGILAEILVRIYFRSGAAESYVVRDEWSGAERVERR